MKKRFIRLFMFVTVITSMGALNSCKDYDAEEHDKELQYKLQEQQASLKALKADFDAKLAAIKQCTCDPQNIQDMINAALANAKVGLTPEEVAEMIAKELANYDGLTAAEVEGIVNNSLKNYAILTQLENAQKELNDALANIQNALDNKAYQEALDLANQAILDLQSRIDEAETLASANKEAIEDLREDLNSMITSIIVQGAKNPVYGYFAMPGVDPNLLIAYYGENEHITYFPTVSTSDLVYEENALTEKDAEMLNGTVDTWNVAGGSTLIDGEEGNAGKLYLTINPNTVDFTGQKVKLVNSLDEESPIKLSPLAASTDKMTFGWTRANNGFYEAKATLSETDIEAAKIRFDLGKMQNDVEDVIKNKSVSGLKGIAQSIYSQLDGLMDANGVKASWTDTDSIEHSIYSQYSVAAAAIKPLSFAFLKGTEISLPFISSISEFNLNDMIDVTKLNIQLDDIQSDFSIQVQFDTLYFKNDECWSQYQLKTNGELDTVWVRLDYVEEDIAKIINNRANIWSAQLQMEFKKQLEDRLHDLVHQINDMTNSIQGKLQTSIQDIIDDVQSSLDSKFSKIESLFNRLNNVLSNPNSKLQVCMLYDGIDNNIHQLSNSKTFPTLLTGTGSIKIYPTTYTLELAAPSYKKFIAVTNVFKNGTSAQDDDPACKSVLEATNAAENFNEVISGTYNGIDFTPAEAGYVYEIFYSALDYSGKISQRKFYVEVQ